MQISILLGGGGIDFNSSSVIEFHYNKIDVVSVFSCIRIENFNGSGGMTEKPTFGDHDVPTGKLLAA